MDNIIFSDRMIEIAKCVPKGKRVADIGTDHGYIPIFLASNGISKEIIAMDVREMPLNKARENIKKEGLSEYIETRLSDGFKALSRNEADVCIISGMGCDLIINIINNGIDVVRGLEKMILSPQTLLYKFRKFLIENEFIIENEKMLFEDGKFYTIFEVVNGEEENIYSDADLKYGKILIDRKDKVLKDYLCKEYNKLNKIYNELEGIDGEEVKERKKELLCELKTINEILGGFWYGRKV